MTSENRKAYFYLLVTFVIWGSLYVVSKYTLGKISPFTLSFFRFLVAVVTLTLMLGKPKKKMEKSDWKYILLIGGAGYFLAVGAQLLGTKYTGASVASLINALNPVTMTLFAMLLLGEAVTVRKITGIALALVGVYVILGGGAAQLSMKGVLFSLFSVVVWSFVSVMTRKVTKKYEPLQITRNSVAVAMVFYFFAALAENRGGAAFEPDAACVTALLYMGSICTGLAYFLWNKSLSVLEAGVCSSFYPVQPLVASIMGILFLKEETGLNFWIGAVLIAVGIVISLRPGRK